MTPTVYEKASDEYVEPQAKTDARLPQTDEHLRGTTNTAPPSSERTVGLDSELRVGSHRAAAPAAALKQTKAFHAVYRRGRWVKGSVLSVGIFPNALAATRVGLRTRRGLKGAVVRNRLKRQLRAALHAPGVSLRAGLDVVIVIHPPAHPARIASRQLKEELALLCKRIGAIP